MNDPWLIEMRAHGEPLWYALTDDGRVYWALKHEYGLQFARREDANRYIRKLQHGMQSHQLFAQRYVDRERVIRANPLS